MVDVRLLVVRFDASLVVECHVVIPRFLFDFRQQFVGRLRVISESQGLVRIKNFGNVYSWNWLLLFGC